MPIIDGDEYDDEVWALAEEVFWRGRQGCYVSESAVNDGIKEIYADLKKVVCKRLAAQGRKWGEVPLTTTPPHPSARPVLKLS